MRLRFAVVAFSLAGLVATAACRAGGPRAAEPAPPAPGAGGVREEPQAPAQKNRTVTVYFADAQAMYLHPTRREVPADRPAAGVVLALLAGPTAEEKDLRPTFPPGTQLRGVTLAGGVATVDFSAELQTNFGGGSAGELMLVYSLANSLAELPGITAVRLTVEGKPLETLGHMDLTEPVAPRPDLVRR